MMRSPFAPLNLAFNPFGSRSREEQGELAVVDSWSFAERLQEATARVALQFMGDQGYGKTTHLLAIRRHCPGPYYHFADGEPVRMPSFHPGDVVFLDEFQRLGRWQRRTIYRRAARLVVATHRDFANEMKMAGFQVDSLEVRDTMTVDRLWQALNRKIDAARRGPGRLPRLRHSTATCLWNRHRGNPRAIEAELYDTYQALKELRDV